VDIPRSAFASALFDLRGSTAVITGGSRGLGRVIADTLASAGAEVVIVSRKLDACQRAADEIAAATGRRTHAIACHVGRWNELDHLVDKVNSTVGRAVDILVNNAGMSPPYNKLSDITEALYDKVMDVNLKGPFRLSALFGEQMVATGGGVIVNISSVAAEQPRPNAAIYAMAKAGLNALTTALAYGFGPTVRVNGVVCGPFLTDISSSWDIEASKEAYHRTMALQRAADPSEIAGALLYLASRASSFTTGTVLRVDGGYTPPSRETG